MHPTYCSQSFSAQIEFFICDFQLYAHCILISLCNTEAPSFFYEIKVVLTEQIKSIFVTLDNLYFYLEENIDDSQRVCIIDKASLKVTDIEQMMSGRRKIERQVLLVAQPLYDGSAYVKQEDRLDLRVSDMKPVATKPHKDRNSVGESRFSNDRGQKEPKSEIFRRYDPLQKARIAEKKARYVTICNEATYLLKRNIDVEGLVSKLFVSEQTAKKMQEQFKRFGRVIPPKQYEESRVLRTNKSGATIKEIKDILFDLVKDGQMESLEEMQIYLEKRGLYRSLASIYRYVSDIKTENPVFESRNYTFHPRHDSTVVNKHMRQISK